VCGFRRSIPTPDFAGVKEEYGDNRISTRVIPGRRFSFWDVTGFEYYII
jgi:hypothetical protein